MRIHKMLLLIVISLTATINLFSQTAEEWKKLGNAELDSAKYEKAIEYYQRAIETDSTYFEAYFNLGVTFSHTLDFDKAIDYYKKAIHFNDTVADSFFALGGVYTQIEDYDNAIEMFKSGIELKPDSPEEYSYLASLYQQKDNYIYTLFYLKKAAKLGDDSAIEYLTDNDIPWEDDFVKPDYEQIKSNIENKQSDLYYPKLWDRYQHGDSTMTPEEKRHLYYGYVFHENYSPYGSKHDSKQVNAILNKEKPTKKEWKKLESLLNTSLSAEPFNCKYLYYQSIAYNALDKPADANENYNKINSILDVLSSTGDGLSKESAIHVIAVYSEYDYLFFYNLSMKLQSLVEGNYDVLYLTTNEDGIEELWFDVNQPLNHFNKLFK